MFRRHLAPVGVLLALPLLTVWITPIQLFPPPGWVDPGIYLGYFLNLPTLVERFGADYSGMRLPWVMSGYVLNAIFSPTAAHHALNLGVHLLATGSLYAIVMPRYGRAAAFLAAGMLTVNPMWIAAATRGYVDGPAVALGLACLAVCSNLSAFSSRWVPAVLVGIVGSLAAFTHPFVGLFTLIGAVAWVVVQHLDFKSLWRMAVIAAMAGVVTSWGLGAISLAVHGPFLFWLPMLDFTKRVAEGHGLAYVRPMEAWLPSAYLQFILFAVLLSGLTALFFSRRDGKRSELLKVGCATLGISLVLYGVMALRSGSAMFQAPFYMNLSLPGVALVLGGLAGEAVTDRLPRRPGQWMVVAGCFLVAGFVPLIGAAGVWDAEEQVRADHLLWILLVGVAIVVCALVRTRKLVAVLLLVSAMGVAGVADPGTRSVYQVDGNPSYKPMFLAQHRVNEFVRDNVDPNQRIPFFWYDRADFRQSAVAREWLWYYLWYQNEPIGLTVYDSIASLWLWDQREFVLGGEMPKMVPARRSRLLQVAPVSVVMFCDHPVQCEKGARALQFPGHVAHLRKQERIVESRYLDFTVAVVEVDRLGG